MSNTKGTELERKVHNFKPTKKQNKANPPPPVQQTDYQEPPTTETVMRYFPYSKVVGTPS